MSTVVFHAFRETLDVVFQPFDSAFDMLNDEPLGDVLAALLDVPLKPPKGRDIVVSFGVDSQNFQPAACEESGDIVISHPPTTARHSAVRMHRDIPTFSMNTAAPPTPRRGEAEHAIRRGSETTKTCVADISASDVSLHRRKASRIPAV